MFILVYNSKFLSLEQYRYDKMLVCIHPLPPPMCVSHGTMNVVMVHVILMLYSKLVCTSQRNNNFIKKNLIEVNFYSISKNGVVVAIAHQLTLTCK